MKSPATLNSWWTVKALLKERNKMKAFFYILIAGSLGVACSGKPKQDEHAGHTAHTAAAPSPQANDLMLSESQVKLANITTQKVSRKPIGQTLVMTARLTVDEELSEVISSRAAGRIEKLFIKETGRVVQKGEALYELYSESLLTLQQEYVLAKKQFDALGKEEPRYGSFLKAAEKKLLLYGLTPKQIGQLDGSGSPKQRVVFLAPASGVVTEINAAEGQYVNEGQSLYRVEDVKKLWIEAEMYPHETAFVKVGDKITVNVAGFESTPVESKVVFLSPEYRNNTQITVMRAMVANPDLRFQPGMQAQVFFTHSEKQAIAIPTDAVIRDGKGTHVYIQSGDNTFRPQMVKTGLEDVNQVEILEGLNNGDTVVVSGAYLLYSEIILKKGADPMTGHGH
jgi:Cu(I)/Ag(I) efflux system membrane fusion protein